MKFIEVTTENIDHQGRPIKIHVAADSITLLEDCGYDKEIGDALYKKTYVGQSKECPSGYKYELSVKAPTQREHRTRIYTASNQYGWVVKESVNEIKALLNGKK